MARFEPNAEQKEFLSTQGCNVLVSASAGSGKTSTMIQKLIKIMLTDKMPITSLLVVTYTNAAASEIRLKLSNEILSLISEMENADDKSFLKKQLDNIGNAEIGTLHAICKKLIVKYFYEIGESPDFGLVQDKEQKYLLDLAIKNIFSQYIESDDDTFFNLYDCYNTNRNDVTLKKIALILYNYKKSKIDFETWKEDFLKNSYNLDLNQNSACLYLQEYYTKQFFRVSRQLAFLRKQVTEFPKYQNFLDVKGQFIDEFVSCSDVETVIKVLNNAIFPSKPSCSLKTATAEEIEFDEKVVLFNKDFNDTIKNAKSDFVTTDAMGIISSISNAKLNVVKLLELIDKIEDEYIRQKKRKNLLDFNDLEDIMLKLLENEQICRDLKSQYRYVFVDEYQDINDKQEQILQGIVSENNYYMIGDVKQSIYAFRQSSPKIFISKYNKYSQDGEIDKLINFNKNYRSDRNILEFANKVFDEIITSETIGIDYRKDARFESSKEFSGCSVSLNVINRTEEVEDVQKLEARLIASELLRLLQLKRENGENYKYSDIAIILRKRGSFIKTLTDVLIGMQIPVKATINSDFFSTKEIGIITSILRVVSNYKNDIAMVTVLKNLFGVSEEEFMRIRLSSSSKNFHECVIEYNEKDAVKEKISSFFEFLNVSKKKLLSQSVSEYLGEVVEDFRIIKKLRCEQEGDKKEDNILEFLKIADNENYKYNLDKFLEYLDFISKDSSLQTIGSDSNAVEICTIHHSKGLEYPAVILAGLGNKFQLNKDSSEIILNNEMGIGLKCIDASNRLLEETVVRNACKLSNIKSELDEEIRLLYVAMTRAKEQLSLVGVYNCENTHSIKRKQIYSVRNYLEYIIRSVDDVYLPFFTSHKDFVVDQGESSMCKVKIYGEEELGEEIEHESKPIILNNVNIELANTMQNVYNNKPSTKTTTIKNTVTNILREEVDYENINFVPKKLDMSDKLMSRDSLKLGTAYHSVMQELSFNESSAEIEGIISRLVAQGKIDAELKSLIKVGEIFKACSVIAKLAEGASNIYREKQFLMCESYNKLVNSTDNNTKVIVQGVIDLVIEKDDKVYLIDYKTNRGVTEHTLIEEYRLQLELYSKAFYEATGRMVDYKYLYSFALGKLVELN